MIAYNSNLPDNIRIDAYSLQPSENMLKLPPVIPPKAVPLLVMQAKAVQSVVSRSMFSREKTRAEIRRIKKYIIVNTVTEAAVAALTGFP